MEPSPRFPSIVGWIERTICRWTCAAVYGGAGSASSPPQPATRTTSTPTSAATATSPQRREADLTSGSARRREQLRDATHVRLPERRERRHRDGRLDAAGATDPAGQRRHAAPLQPLLREVRRSAGDARAGERVAREAPGDREHLRARDDAPSGGGATVSSGRPGTAGGRVRRTPSRDWRATAPRPGPSRCRARRAGTRRGGRAGRGRSSAYERITALTQPGEALRDRRDDALRDEGAERPCRPPVRAP